jgi:hypothetical protein
MIKIRTAERLASVISAKGVIWVSYAASKDFVTVWQLPVVPSGPLEISTLGIVLWLHAKWRRSLKS